MDFINALLICMNLLVAIAKVGYVVSPDSWILPGIHIPCLATCHAVDM